MESVRPRQLIIALLLIASVTPVITVADGDDSETILQDVLHEQFPRVENWRIELAKAVHVKRAQKIFSQPGPQITIYRNGNLFSVRAAGMIANYVVAANKQTLVARTFIGKGSLLNSKNANLEFRDTFALDCLPVTREDSSALLRVRHNIRSGDAICSRDVETVPLIAKHEALKLQCNRGDISVSVLAEAMEEGNVGEIIKVRRGATRSIIAAKILSKGEVDACI